MSVLYGVADVVYADTAFFHGHTFVFEHSDNGISGDAGKYRTYKRGSFHYAVEHEEHIHRAHFLNILFLFRVQPEHLFVAVLVGDIAREQACGVVAHTFCLARAAQRRANVFVFDHYLRRGQTAFVIASDRRQNDKETVSVSGMHAEHGIGRYHRGTDIKRGAGLGGDPVLVYHYKLFEVFDGFLDVQSGHAKSCRGTVHASEIVIGTEHSYFAVLVLVRFQTFEDPLSVMQYAGRRIESERLIRHYFGFQPFAVLIVHDEHMVGKILSETELRIIGLSLFLLRESDFHNTTSCM